MSGISGKIGLGWLPDYPDFRDQNINSDSIPEKLLKLGQKDSVKVMLKKTMPARKSKAATADSVSLIEWFSEIEDQESLGSCTANAGVGLVEYFEKRAFNRYIDASRLFLYKATRNMMKQTGDTGAHLRSTMGALVLFGVPPEEYWPYKITDFDKEPTAFCYAFAQNYQSITYYRLDPPGISRPDLLAAIKTNLNSGLPSMFGFTVYSSIEDAAVSGKIPFPGKGEKILGGHAVVAAGYDDKMTIKNSKPGAFLIRNSWGTSWGDKGYGWLPYDYVLNFLAVDWWLLLKNEWVDTGNFKSDV
jgi:C1A family cysteine protease